MNQAWRNLVSKNVKELRFIVCQNGLKSLGVRNWINSNIVELKKTHPDTLLLVRECENVDPVILARYDFGAEKKIICEYSTAEEVEEIVGKLVVEGEKINKQVNNKI